MTSRVVRPAQRGELALSETELARFERRWRIPDVASATSRTVKSTTPALIDRRGRGELSARLRRATVGFRHYSPTRLNLVHFHSDLCSAQSDPTHTLTLPGRPAPSRRLTGTREGRARRVHPILPS